MSAASATDAGRPARQHHPLANRCVLAVLRSPLHTLLDPGLRELRYRGRRSGRSIALPVMIRVRIANFTWSPMIAPRNCRPVRKRWPSGSNRIVIHDVVENLTSHPAEMQMLYHCNIGAPFVEAGRSALSSGEAEWRILALVAGPGPLPNKHPTNSCGGFGNWTEIPWAVP